MKKHLKLKFYHVMMTKTIYAKTCKSFISKTLMPLEKKACCVNTIRHSNQEIFYYE